MEPRWPALNIRRQSRVSVTWELARVVSDCTIMSATRWPATTRLCTSSRVSDALTFHADRPQTHLRSVERVVLGKAGIASHAASYCTLCRNAWFGLDVECLHRSIRPWAARARRWTDRRRIWRGNRCRCRWRDWRRGRSLDWRCGWSSRWGRDGSTSAPTSLLHATRSLL